MAACLVSAAAGWVNPLRRVRLPTPCPAPTPSLRSPAHAFIDTCPELLGLPFGQLHFLFPDAVVVGLHNSRTGYCQLNPPPERLVQQGDDVVTLRPGRMGLTPYRPLRQAVRVDMGSWRPEQYTLRWG